MARIARSASASSQVTASSTSYWWRKVELGRGDEVRRCIYTNDCEGLDQKHVPVTCQLWDRVFDEPDFGGAEPRMVAGGKRRLLPPRWSPA